MDPDSLEDHKKELRALEYKMLAFPEEDWRRERTRCDELKILIAAEEAERAAHA